MQQVFNDQIAGEVLAYRTDACERMILTLFGLLVFIRDEVTAIEKKHVE